MNIGEVINDQIESKLLDLNTAFFGKVVAVKGGKADVQPLQMYKSYGGEAKQHAVLKDVPIPKTLYKIELIEWEANPPGDHPPSIEGAEDQLRSGTWQHARRDYGNPLPDVLQKRLKKEHLLRPPERSVSHRYAVQARSGQSAGGPGPGRRPRSHFAGRGAASAPSRNLGVPAAVLCTLSGGLRYPRHHRRPLLHHRFGNTTS